MSSETMNQPTLESLSELLGYRFNDGSLLLLALTHKSYSHEQSGGQPNVQNDNERLEYLGDAVLDLALSDCLMDRFANDPEGSLSKKRASLVNEETLAGIAIEINIDYLIRLGRGEIKTGGLRKPRILASSLEAVFGAVFRDGGYDRAKEVVERLFHSRLEELGVSEIDFKHDFKTRLQEKIQEQKRATPAYLVESESGPDHDKIFLVSVRIDENVLAIGKGKSKKAAEQDAARNALEQMS